MSDDYADGIDAAISEVGRRDRNLAEILSVAISMADDFAVLAVADGREVMVMPVEDFESMVRGMMGVRDIMLGLRARAEVTILPGR